MREILSVVGLAVIGMMTLFLFYLIMAWPFQFLWNWLVPSLFGLREITLPEALGLLCLWSFVRPGSGNCCNKEKK